MRSSLLRFLSAFAVVSLLLAFSVSPAHANSSNPEMINFNYLQSLQSIGNFYDGGGAANVPNYGVSFNNFWGLRSTTSLGFSPDPTGTPIAFINSSLTTPAGSPVTGLMNVANGFSTGLNFYFNGLASGNTETVTVWSGANGTGNVLATLNLYSNSGSCGGTVPNCLWTSVSTGFTGTAHSVTFSGPADQMGIADITIGSTHTAVPEPSTFYLLASGIVGVGANRIRRFFGI